MKKFNLDEIEEKKYVPKGRGYNDGNYYVARINDKNVLLDCEGNTMDYPLMMPNNSLKMEHFAHLRFKHLCRAVSNGEEVGIVDKKGNIAVPYIYKTITQHLNGNFTAETIDGEKINIKEADLIKGTGLSGKIRIITKSEHFIYFVKEEENKYLYVAVISIIYYFDLHGDFKNSVDENSLPVIMKIKLSNHSQTDYAEKSPYKLEDIDEKYRQEIENTLNSEISYNNKSVSFYDYASLLWEELNNKESETQEIAFETIPISKNRTKIQMNVELVQQDFEKTEKPYLFVQNDYNENKNYNLVKVGLDGTPVDGETLVFYEECEQYELKQWIELNKLAILMYWTHSENNSNKISKMIRSYYCVSPKFGMGPENFNGQRIIHATELIEYFKSIKDEIIGKPINKIYYTGTLYNRMWDDAYEYKNGEWYVWGSNEKSDEPGIYPWKESNSVLWLDLPVILDFGKTRLEIEYWSGSLVRVNTNSIDVDNYGADVSKHFSRHIIGQKLVDIRIRKRKEVYFMNFGHLGIERNDGDDMFEEIWFIFENGYKLELKSDSCDYTIFCERDREFECRTD